MFLFSSGWHSLPFLYTGIISVDRNYFKFFKFTTINMTQIKLSLLLILAAVIIEPIQVVALPAPPDFKRILNEVPPGPVQVSGLAASSSTHPHPQAGNSHPQVQTVNPASSTTHTGTHTDV